MSAQNAPTPTNIKLHQRSAVLELHYPEQQRYELSYEYLRVYSPSAEVRGHGKGQETLQVGKKHIGISGVEPVGNYAIRINFDDGHDSGLYSWDYLFGLCVNQASNWQDYLERMHSAGASRDPEAQVLSFDPNKMK